MEFILLSLLMNKNYCFYDASVLWIISLACLWVMMCVLMSTRKRTNRLQYSVCKCEVESTGKWSNMGVLFNQLHFNLVPKV
jgi:hypothetical protein